MEEIPCRVPRSDARKFIRAGHTDEDRVFENFDDTAEEEEKATGVYHRSREPFYGKPSAFHYSVARIAALTCCLLSELAQALRRKDQVP